MCATELEALKNKIKNVHMVDAFAAYSKLERRIKVLERQLRDLAPETFVGSMTRRFGIYFTLHAIEAIFIAYLISRAPAETISRETLYSIKKADDSMHHQVLVTICTVLSYIPAKILVISWVILCRSTISLTVSKVESKFQQQGQQSDENSNRNPHQDTSDESSYHTPNGSL
ncbi:unnamed protein product [Trichobilharzia szidati]|nr:unnamed protein product [Trichobilharzia szidati]